jgi:carbonic anhydrase
MADAGPYSPGRRIRGQEQTNDPLPRAVVVALGLAIVTIGAVGTQGAQTKHWAYEDHGDEVGPAKWGTLPGNAACASGKQQTPINLVAGAAKAQDLPDLVFGYKPSKLSIINNGHTVQMTYDAGSTLARTGSADTSTLAQFHFMRRASTPSMAHRFRWRRTSCTSTPPARRSRWWASSSRPAKRTPG